MLDEEEHKMVESQSPSVQMMKNVNIHHKGSKEILTGEGSEGNEGGEKKQQKQKQDGTKEGIDKVHEERQRKKRQTSATNDKRELKLKSTPTNDSVLETPVKKIEVDGAKGDEKLMKQAAEGSSQSQDSTRERYILKIREKINWLIAEKSILEATIEAAIAKFPDDERFVKYRDQLYTIFKR